MRAYTVDSPHAAGRILALTMMIDGNLAGSELAALDRSKILEHIQIDQASFMQFLQDLCNDLATSTPRGVITIDDALIDSLLEEIKSPELRRTLLRAMWCIVDADGWLADSEARLLTRASNAWSAETNFSRVAKTL